MEKEEIIERFISKLGEVPKAWQISCLLYLEKGIETTEREIKQILKKLKKEGKIIYSEPAKAYFYVG